MRDLSRAPRMSRDKATIRRVAMPFSAEVSGSYEFVNPAGVYEMDSRDGELIQGPEIPRPMLASPFNATVRLCGLEITLGHLN